MNIKQSVVEVLQRQEVSNIDFTLFGVNVLGAWYHELSHKLTSGRLSVARVRSMPEDRTGDYFPSSDLLVFRNNQPGFRRWRSFVVHESTHAVLDLKRIPVMKIDSELFAYSAQFIFLRKSRYPFSERPFRNPSISVPALALADALLSGGPMPSRLITDLRSAIASHPRYSSYGSDMALSNGI